MGFFSWNTQDTKKSIANKHSTQRAFPVTMTDDKGNKWHEKGYDGYGMFDGKDFYELLAEMNGQKTRDDGIALAFGNEPYLSPNLSEDENWKWKDDEPETCEFQGFFY